MLFISDPNRDCAVVSFLVNQDAIVPVASHHPGCLGEQAELILVVFHDIVGILVLLLW